MEDTFNCKLASWLSDALERFDKNDIQELIFDLPHRANEDTLTEEDNELITILSEWFLKLSFILTKHKKEVLKLIEYLD